MRGSETEMDGEHARPTTSGWLAWLCLSRLALSMIFTAYAAVLPLVREAWGLSAAKAATVQSAWHFGYLVSLFAAGLLADRYGARRTYLAASVFATAMAFAFALGSRGYASALVLYGLAGLCSGGSYTPGLAVISEQAPPHARGRAMGWFLGASSIGYGAELAGVGILSAVTSWRAGLLLGAWAAGVGTLLGWIALRTLRDPARPAKDPGRVWSGLVETLRDRTAMACNWAYTFHCWELFVVWAWLPTYLAASAGGSVAGAGRSWGIALAGFAHLLGATGSVGGGTASDRWGRSRVMLLFSSCSLMGSFLFGWLSAWPFVVLVLLGAVYNLFAIADSSIYSTALADTVPAQRLGAAYSVRSVMGFGTGIVSPVVFGAALDFGRAQFGAGSTLPWALAWSSAGIGGILGPVMIARFARLTGSQRRGR
jgi:MFS family permease